MIHHKLSACNYSELKHITSYPLFYRLPSHNYRANNLASNHIRSTNTTYWWNIRPHYARTNFINFSVNHRISRNIWRNWRTFDVPTSNGFDIRRQWNHQKSIRWRIYHFWTVHYWRTIHHHHLWRNYLAREYKWWFTHCEDYSIWGNYRIWRNHWKRSV